MALITGWLGMTAAMAAKAGERKKISLFQSGYLKNPGDIKKGYIGKTNSSVVIRGFSAWLPSNFVE